ncbi:MAG: DUF1449 family protein [Candidatus Competibacteraceae bacterium]
MLEFITADGNLPFSVALALMLLIALLEGVGTVLGFGFSHLLDQLTPGIDLSPETPDLDGDSGVVSRLLGWLHVGKVPMLALLVVFLTAFGLLGFDCKRCCGNFRQAVARHPRQRHRVSTCISDGADRWSYPGPSAARRLQ